MPRDVLLFLHLTAMSLWFGGQIFLLVVGVPALRPLDEATRAMAFKRLGRGFLAASAITFVVLIATGLPLASQRGLLDHPTNAFNAKMMLIGATFVLTGVHTVAGARQLIRLSRMATMMTFLTTCGIVWYAVHI